MSSHGKDKSDWIPQQERFPGNEVPGMEYTTARPIEGQNGMPACPIPPTHPMYPAWGDGSFTYSPNKEKARE